MLGLERLAEMARIRVARQRGVWCLLVSLLQCLLTRAVLPLCVLELSVSALGAVGILEPDTRLIASHSVQAQSKSVALVITPGTTAQLSRAGSTVTIVVRNNGTNLRDQIDRLRTQAVTGLLVLSGATGETIIRISMAPGYQISQQISRNPPRLILNMQAPVKPKAAAVSRSRASASAIAALAPADLAPTEATEGGVSSSALERLPLDEALTLVLDVAEPPRRPVDMNSNVLCVGSRVMYPIPLPNEKVTLEDWTPATVGTATGVEADLIKRGLDLMAQNMGYEAEQELRKFERRYPKSASVGDVRYLIIEAKFSAALKARKNTSRMEAIERLRDQLRTDPKNYNRIRSLYLAGRTYLDLKYYHEASTMFRDALAAVAPSDPNRAKVLLALAWADYNRYANDDSLLAYRTAFPLVNEEKKGEILLALASLMAQKGWYSHLLDMLSLIKIHYPKRVNTQLYRVLLAEGLYRMDRLIESRTLFEQLRAELGKDVPRLYEFRIGEAFIVEQRFKEARKLFFAPSLEPTADKRKWQEAMQALRNLQMDMVTDKDSETRLLGNLEKLRKLRTESPFAPVAEEVTIEFIKYYVARSNLTDALGMLKTFLTAHAGNSHNRTMLQLVWDKVQSQILEDYNAERYFEMLGLYERAYPIVSSAGAYESKVTYLVARAYLNLGLFDQAYKTISEGFFIEGSTDMLEDNSLLMLAEIQRGQGKFEESRRALTFLRKKSTSPESLRQAMLQEARTWEKEGKIAEATRVYRQYVAMEPEMALRVKELTHAGAMVTQAQGCDAALPVLKDAVQLATQMKGVQERTAVADTFYRYGECLFSVKKYTESADVLRDAMSRDPAHPLLTFARYAIAKSYIASSRQQDGELLLQILADESAKNPDDPWSRMAAEEIEQLNWRRAINGMN